MTTTIEQRYVGQVGTKIYDLHDRNERIEFVSKKWEKYICNMASKFRNSVSGYDDFLQEANLLIIKASDNWDPNRSKARFETYAFTCIRNGLIDFSTRTKGAVSVPSGSMQLEESKFKTLRLNENILDESTKNSIEYTDLLDIIESFEHFRIAKLYFIQRFTLEEIAKEIGESRSTVHRKIQEMKNELKDKL